MTFVLIEVIEKINDNRISKCKIRGIFYTKDEAKNMLHKSQNKLIIVPNISLRDIKYISISDYDS